MKRILILTFFVCVICSSLCFGENKARQNINSQSNFAFSKTNNEFPNIFRSIGNLFSGYCGPSMTKTVVIKKCPDCKDE